MIVLVFSSPCFVALIRLPIFRYALLWCAAHSVTHYVCAPSFAPSTPRLPKNMLRSMSFE